MRPTLLFPLFHAINSLKGIGPRMAPLYERLCGKYVVDLLWHLPSGLIDRSYAPKLSEAEKGRIATLQLKVEEHQVPRIKRLPYRIRLSDGRDDLIVSYFNAKGDYLEKIYPNGQDVVLSGTLDRYQNKWSMNHPDYVLRPDQRAEIPRFEAVYPLTEGISGRSLRKAIEQALGRVPLFPEWHDASLLKREAWTDFRSALMRAHKPLPENIESVADKPKDTFRERLAYDELLADQLALAVIRRHHRAGRGRAFPGTRTYQDQLKASLPFRLTNGQNQAISEISADMASNHRMLRLLQGDVGSGKTLVALMAMLQATESGVQAALMAPTEILAKQHHAKLQSFLTPLGLEIGLLLGGGRGIKGADRQKTLRNLEDGTLKLVVGTHALFQDDVVFKDLGLAVVDEQHRFGVNERLRLSDKGRGVDILVMTATPIPRTLTLTAFGDMDVSKLTDKPEGRSPIDTRLIDAARLDEVIEGVKRQIAKGTQVYWVCPLVAESELIDLAAATDRAQLLSKKLGNDNVGLVHGQMPADEKDKVMAAFVGGAIKVLVATTVIEVGVDVPNASLMVIEHSERFGLAQLHQLRGRVGRGTAKSDCLLMYRAPLGAVAKARLTMLRESQDGFRLAEEDLKLRGPGELLGKRQSGMPEFRLADLSRHRHLLEIASEDAKLILNKDPELKSERGQALRILLYLFEREAAVPLLRAG